MNSDIELILSTCIFDKAASLGDLSCACFPHLGRWCEVKAPNMVRVHACNLPSEPWRLVVETFLKKDPERVRASTSSSRLTCDYFKTLWSYLIIFFSSKKPKSFLYLFQTFGSQLQVILQKHLHSDIDDHSVLKCEFQHHLKHWYLCCSSAGIMSSE